MTIRNQRFSLLKQPISSTLNQHLIDYPTPSNLSYWWGFGPLAGICLVIQIVTGVFLAMHYTPHVDLAFNSVEHVMRDVEGGWLLRYMHANGASMFLIVVHLHIFRGLYHASYSSPREFVRCLGVVIFLLMMNELSEAVAQFYPTLEGSGALGGMNGGFNPPPAPENSSVLAAASHEAAPSDAEGRAPRDLVSELQNDPYLCTTYRNALLKQEEIIKLVKDLVLAGQIPIDDDDDIRKAVEVYLADFMSQEPRSRNPRLARIITDLSVKGSESRYFTAILKEISALRGF